MRLNIRLMGVLFGIMVITLIGRRVLFSMRHVRSKDSAKAGSDCIGHRRLPGCHWRIGRVLCTYYQSQRVTTARVPGGRFCRAVHTPDDRHCQCAEKIGGYQARVALSVPQNPEEVSHMLFGTGSNLSRLFATHPPLTERIQALEPGFNPEDYPVVDYRGHVSHCSAPDGSRRAVRRRGRDDCDSGRHAWCTAQCVIRNRRRERRPPQPGTGRIYAGKLRQSIPEKLYAAAHSPEDAYLLSIALILDRGGRVLGRQLSNWHTNDSVSGERQTSFKQVFR